MSFMLTKGVLQQQVNRAGAGGVPTDGLISYWKLDETSGPVVDSWGDNDGTNEGALRGIEGKVGNAFEFDGDAIVPVGTLPNSMYGANERAIGLWINVDVFGDSTENRIFTFADSGSEGRSFTIFAEDGAISMGFTGCRVITPKNELNTGAWYLIGVNVPKNATFDEIEIYINGNKSSFSLEAGSHVVIDTVLPTNHTSIGGGDTSHNKFEGVIDEISCYERMLTSEEWLQLYNEGKGITL